MASRFPWCKVGRDACWARKFGIELRLWGRHVVWKCRRARRASDGFASSSRIIIAHIFFSVFPAPYLTDRRLSSNRPLGLPSSSANSQASIASRRPSPPPHRVAHNCSSVEPSSGLHRRFGDHHAIYIRTLHISFHVSCLVSPFYVFPFTLDVAFKYCRSLLRPRRPRTRRCPPGDHSNIFF